MQPEAGGQRGGGGAAGAAAVLVGEAAAPTRTKGPAETGRLMVAASAQPATCVSGRCTKAGCELSELGARGARVGRRARTTQLPQLAYWSNCPASTAVASSAEPSRQGPTREALRPAIVTPAPPRRLVQRYLDPFSHGLSQHSSHGLSRKPMVQPRHRRAPRVRP